ncbi:MAG: PIG-L family deacetylase [Candidatus Heimdallarchaeota archaeon]|nr:PIG-L family deacetylase [Candidatus Heimdallarchaeota archaeon]MDH5646661.1 PIG-L family deacetylase [Candidatus Heimdallarchaeota archaeon]
MQQLDTQLLGDRILFISAHDDDSLIGCGGLISNLINLNKEIYTIIFTDGSLGYTRESDKNEIVERRKRECIEIYTHNQNNVVFFDLPDMSLNNYECWETITGDKGGYQLLFYHLRKIRPDSVFIPHHYDRHPDHQSVNRIAKIICWQVTQPILPDYGKPLSQLNLYAYQVWDKIKGAAVEYILNKRDQEFKKNTLQKFKSQQLIINQFISDETNLLREHYQLIS